MNKAIIFLFVSCFCACYSISETKNDLPNLFGILYREDTKLFYTFGDYTSSFNITIWASKTPLDCNSWNLASVISYDLQEGYTPNPQALWTGKEFAVFAPNYIVYFSTDATTWTNFPLTGWDSGIAYFNGWFYWSDGFQLHSFNGTDTESAYFPNGYERVQGDPLVLTSNGTVVLCQDSEGSGDDGGYLLLTGNRGKTWESPNLDNYVGEVDDEWVFEGPDGLISVVAETTSNDVYLVQSADYGNTFTAVSQICVEDYAGEMFYTNGIYYYIGEEALISTDGKEWNLYTNPNFNSPLGNYIVDILFEGNLYFAITWPMDYEYVLVSENGISWQPLINTLPWE